MHPSFISTLAFVAVGTCLVHSSLSGQGVRGRLLDQRTTEPIPGAVVILLNQEGDHQATTRTDSLGHFELVAPAAGDFRVEGGQIGYFHAATPTLLLQPGVVRRVEMFLPPDPFAMDPINVQARARARALRNPRTAPTAVRRLEEEQIRHLSPQVDMAGLLRAMNAPTLRVHEVQRYPGSSIFDLCIELVRTRSPSQMGCRWVAVYLDGVRVFDAGWILQFLDTSVIKSIELIPPTEAGARWGTGSQNGVLLIWTTTGTGFHIRRSLNKGGEPYHTLHGVRDHAPLRAEGPGASASLLRRPRDHRAEPR